MGRKNLVEVTDPSLFLSERKEGRLTRKPPADRKSNISVASTFRKLSKGVKLKSISKNLHWKSLPLSHLYVINAKNMKS